MTSFENALLLDLTFAISLAKDILKSQSSLISSFARRSLNKTKQIQYSLYKYVCKIIKPPTIDLPSWLRGNLVKNGRSTTFPTKTDGLLTIISSDSVPTSNQCLKTRKNKTEADDYNSG